MASIRKEFWTDADVKCPFYISDNRAERSIRCEGFAEGMSTVFRFRSLEQRERYMGVHCVSRYESCPMYHCTYDGKYREGGGA